MSIEDTEQEAAALAKVPEGRVKLVDIMSEIAWVFFTDGEEVARSGRGSGGEPEDVELVYKHCALTTVCLLVMRNGYTVIGTSTPAHKDNFNPDLGRKLAHQDAIRKLWPILGYVKCTANQEANGGPW